MKRIVLVGLAVALFSLAGSVSSAQAQMGCGGGWGGWGANFPYGLYGSRVNNVPYYAMFPPVYYSAPVPRSYGWSPFAYPPGTMTPEVVAEEPQEMVNPYVTPPRDAKPSSINKTAIYRAPVPQIVINPYVTSANLASTARAQR
jgi:hypothetical protein